MTDRLATIFSENLKVPAGEITDQTSPDNSPRWDSLAAVNLVLALEDEFGVRFTTREIPTMRSVGAVRTILRAKGISDV